jgi:hypothetical protein
MDKLTSKKPSRALKLQNGAEIWNWARNEKWYKNDIKSRKGQNIDIISQLYHPLKNDIKISLSSKKWYNDMIVYQWYTIFQCLIFPYFFSFFPFLTFGAVQTALSCMLLYSISAQDARKAESRVEIEREKVVHFVYI